MEFPGNHPVSNGKDEGREEEWDTARRKQREQFLESDEAQAERLEDEGGVDPDVQLERLGLEKLRKSLGRNPC